MPRIRQWFYRLVLVLLVLFLLFTLYFPVVGRLIGTPYPSLFGFRQALVLTGSMEPTVRIGDLILIRHQAEYEMRDIVTYQDGSRLVTHRIVDRMPGRLVTQGDANNTPDTPVSEEQVLGKMILKLPQLGTIAWFLKTPIGIATILLLGLLLCGPDRRMSIP